MEISFEVSLDGDGYLDRSCPVCERLFRWHDGPVGELPLSAPQIESYFCPYCGEESPSDQWWTPEQVENLQRLAASQIMPELMRDLKETTKKISSSGFIKIDVSGNDHSAPPPLFVNESLPLIAIASPCHPYEPTKILLEWKDPVHCLVCGQLFQIPTN